MNDTLWRIRPSFSRLIGIRTFSLLIGIRTFSRLIGTVSELFIPSDPYPNFVVCFCMKKEAGRACYILRNKEVKDS